MACTHAGSYRTVASIAAEMSEVLSYKSLQSAAKGKIHMTIFVIVYRTYATTRQTHDVQHTVACPTFHLSCVSRERENAHRLVQTSSQPRLGGVRLAQASLSLLLPHAPDPQR